MASRLEAEISAAPAYNPQQEAGERINYLAVVDQVNHHDTVRESTRLLGVEISDAHKSESSLTLTGQPTHLQSLEDILSTSGGDQLLQGTRISYGRSGVFLAGLGETARADARIILAVKLAHERWPYRQAGLTPAGAALVAACQPTEHHRHARRPLLRQRPSASAGRYRAGIRASSDAPVRSGNFRILGQVRPTPSRRHLSVEFLMHLKPRAGFQGF